MGGLRNECSDTYLCGMPHVYKPFSYTSVVLEGWQGGPIKNDRESPAEGRLTGTDSLE